MSELSGTKDGPTDHQGDSGSRLVPPSPAAPSLAEPASRRRFVGLVGAAGGAAALSVLLAACGGEDEETEEAKEESGAAEPATDLEIVNYALLLEYLERDFYAQAVESGNLRPEYQTLAREIQSNEAEHVAALVGVAKQLGGTPVDAPRSDFNDVINAGEQRILEGAATLENIGAAAYLGQAAQIQNTFILEAALTIHTVEARHAAALNEIAGNGFQGGDPLSGSIPDGPFAAPMTRDEVLRAAAPFIRV